MKFKKFELKKKSENQCLILMNFANSQAVTADWKKA